MKKLLQVISALICLSAVTSVHSVVITETYEGRQFVNEGDVFNFEFNMWHVNLPGSTDSSLVLTSDATSPEDATWNSASISLSLWSWDPAFEESRWIITAYDIFGDASYLINQDQFVWNGGINSGYHYQNATYNFTAEDLAHFSEMGWGNVRVEATRISLDDQQVNDFYVKEVSMTVDVPEPSTLLLTALGLLGVGYSSRKRA